MRSIILIFLISGSIFINNSLFKIKEIDKEDNFNSFISRAVTRLVKIIFIIILFFLLFPLFFFLEWFFGLPSSFRIT